MLNRAGDLYKDKNVEHYGFLLLGYKKEYYFWDIIVWSRTILVYTFYGLFTGATEGTKNF